MSCPYNRSVGLLMSVVGMDATDESINPFQDNPFETTPSKSQTTIKKNSTHISIEPKKVNYNKRKVSFVLSHNSVFVLYLISIWILYKTVVLFSLLFFSHFYSQTLLLFEFFNSEEYLKFQTKSILKWYK